MRLEFVGQSACFAAVLLLGCSIGGDPEPMDGGPTDSGAVDAGPPPRADTGPRDAGRDATPCGLDRALCEAGCTDLDSDPANCGACGTVCPVVDNATAVCVETSCDAVCQRGFAEVDGVCLPAPRPLWPPSLSRTANRAPTFRWALPDGLTDATLEVCSEPACDTVLATETAPATTNEASLAAPLASGVVYWRVRSAGRVSPTWALRIPVGSVEGTRAWGIQPDANRDGFADLAVGAPRVGEEEGRVYVYLGGASGPSATPHVVLRSPAGDGGSFGIELGWLGDLDGDGYAELGVGAPEVGESAGRVYVYFGSADGFLETPQVTLDAPDGADSLFGSTLAGLGDVDGDGYGDALIGASGDGLTPGRAYLLLGGEARLLPVAQTLSRGGRFASAMAGAGDLNGDGFADAIVGAYGTASDAGAAYLFFGGTDGLSEDGVRTLPGPDGSGTQFGFRVAAAGDLDGDGYPDVAAASPAFESSRGRVHVFAGGPGVGQPSASDAPTVSIDGVNTAGGFFGHALSAAGDVDGDGFADLAVGAFGVSSRRGRAVVYLGGVGGVTSAERVEVAGLGDGHDFGWSLSSGDVDGNGRSDLIVGAPGADDRGGRAYVLRGISTGVESSPFVTFIGPSGGAFGRALASSVR
ncbi:MAG: FG-GAP-like repeat-containing protein [Sandaracinaceae bacterium]